MGWKSLGFIENLCWDNEDENIIENISDSFNSLLSYQKMGKVAI